MIRRPLRFAWSKEAIVLRSSGALSSRALLRGSTLTEGRPSLAPKPLDESAQAGIPWHHARQLLGIEPCVSKLTRGSLGTPPPRSGSLEHLVSFFIHLLLIGSGELTLFGLLSCSGVRVLRMRGIFNGVSVPGKRKLALRQLVTLM